VRNLTIENKYSLRLRETYLISCIQNLIILEIDNKDISDKSLILILKEGICYILGNNFDFNKKRYPKHFLGYNLASRKNLYGFC